jgi:hypothetical protein
VPKLQEHHQEVGEGVVLLGEQGGEGGVLVGGMHLHQMSKNPEHLHQFLLQLEEEGELLHM